MKKKLTSKHISLCFWSLFDKLAALLMMQQHCNIVTLKKMNTMYCTMYLQHKCKDKKNKIKKMVLQI